MVWVLEDCSYWYYLNFDHGSVRFKNVLEDCSYWYYLNNSFFSTDGFNVLEDCSYWYYLNNIMMSVAQQEFLRIVVIGII